MTGKPWEASYPPSLRGYEVDPATLDGNLADLIGAGAARFGDAPAFTLVLPDGAKGTISHARLDALSDRFAGFLAGDLALVPGDVLAIQLPNSLHYPIAVLGAWKAGLIVTNVNPLYTSREVAIQLADSGAKALVCHELFLAPVREIAATEARALIVASFADTFHAVAAVGEDGHQEVRFDDALARGVPLSPRRRHPVALYQYTGGTTGRSKGAVLTHANQCAILHMARDYMQAFEVTLEPGDAIITALPFYHIFAFNFNFLLMLWSGVHNLLIPNPRPLTNLKPAFDAFRVDWITGVDTLYAGLLAEPWFGDRPRRLKLAVSGGASLRADTAARWRERGGVIVEGYGMTETSCFVSFNPPGPAARDGTVGLLMPGCQARVVDENGDDVPPGHPGELLVRGPHIIERYLNRPEETATAIVDGWLHTGDIVIMDQDGYLRIVDRKKDLILVSGFNVYPNEIEDVLTSHPDVLEAAVIGVPDAVTGEAVRAFVSTTRAAVTGEELGAFCRERLTAYKVPKQFEMRDQLPKSPVGKILRAQLRMPSGAT
ncbi:long-chain fatty acid--CoA ligase [Sphingomonas sp. RP10(2022)]|uniref:Long-chain-fatty-acid--CoA ligase n=1 Tax=Sphingomonas liriopis TaxID=2949094 RepID=A0A9X2I1H2_9SPHN|nr:long-chain fatty acid--CoA ligase [Sphingomonas liriopis]MCP3736125.1 long-chain fatty acid--CoA ligase [Sphingomonas liriopis]